MFTTSLRKVGEAVMLTVPPALLEILRLTDGTQVGLVVEHGRLIVEPRSGPRYTMDELLAASDYEQPQAATEREWVDAPAAGREIL
ncbi:antitoxin [Lichenihabitans sp. Uapishka_5]|nr:antitoxin [Lichenihabitans sp. Uapishka_5]MDX7951984.1 antitoxin [Lichenihabitans sp. Uapishka_5]